MQEWIIYKEFRFEAAHKLPHHEGKCRRLHGHSWVGRIYVKGNELMTEGSQQGMIIDYGEIKKYIEPLLDQFLDHYYLNETTGLENPTSELLAKWIYEQLESAKLPGLYAVEIHETCTSGCMYRKLD
ncbi:6-carboxytetrahydropterin synthase QueD [Aphanothece hegewaldii CCALA 016]|uniref:6-carboxy-5,6,7,8-tetrahydropterin synthase n=1 Tax=Aphanothece hegewaldii CCALA 016 TaxID=2107694 RepID=A0A2T1LV52_9CHRO|nr:6-carboxytetrahydropterin synthase QueD [Aphanothece hegewaldii]PSF35562.1 6-carboxytetrahydropterin synthase QueD [Aphanothece hegewaldii CCALA 016]